MTEARTRRSIPWSVEAGEGISLPFNFARTAVAYLVDDKLAVYAKNGGTEVTFCGYEDLLAPKRSENRAEDLSRQDQDDKIVAGVYKFSPTRSVFEIGPYSFVYVQDPESYLRFIIDVRSNEEPPHVRTVRVRNGADIKQEVKKHLQSK
jgi:hypothetical protein